jgi:hypothetical protein
MKSPGGERSAVLRRRACSGVHRRKATQVGLVLTIAFHVALGLFFSRFLTGYLAIMLMAKVLLLRTEFHPSARVAEPVADRLAQGLRQRHHPSRD